jgi:dynein heavy chain, axonemal
MKTILIGTNIVSYNPEFRLYLVTSLPNPHYTPEVITKVTLLNYTVTPEGLK